MNPVPFLEDIYPRNLLYAVTIRSPISCGNLKMIQFPKLPDNYTIITARNIPGKNIFLDTNMPVLADNRLSYKGEPVAIILGPNKITLEALASKCIVLVDEEKPEFSCLNSKEPLEKREIDNGNADKEFEKDKLIVTSSYSTGIQDHWYAEPTGAITWYEDSGKKKKKGDGIIIKTATQWPSHVKNSVAEVLSINPALVKVEQTALSLHMDGKLWYPSLIACHAALGTYITKQPVRLILNREEDFYYSPKRCSSHIDLASTIDKKGKITATKANISVNLGAYGVNTDEIIDQICIGTAGNYNIDNFKLTAQAISTNLPPQGPFCGFGLSQGLFAIERHISLICDMVNTDPAIWRREMLKNTSVPLSLFDMVIKNSDYSRKWTAYELLRQSHKGSLPEKGEAPRGIGFAIGFQGNGLIHNPKETSTCTVETTLTKDNKLEIKTGIASAEDYSRIWEKIAVKALSIEPGIVKIINNDAPDCGPSCSSRNITLVTKLVEKCCNHLKKQKHSPLPVTVRRTVKAGSNKQPDNSCFLKPGYACAVVEVSIDLVECTPKIRGIWLVIDGGKLLSKNRARRALTRGVIQALGWSYLENIEYINGELTKKQYDNFSIPSPVEIPPIHIDFLENEKTTEPKGIGDLPFNCIPAAFLQAVTQAMDHSFKHIPLKRTDIWEMAKLKT